jgi:CheY-like chemotaxis protein
VRILVVEDDESIREFIGTFLMDEGYEVMLATNGAEALRLVEQQQPELIFLDIYMPVMDGPAFIEAYRQAVPQTVPVIGMSANANEVRMLGSFDGFIAKPFDLTELLDCVEQYATTA